MKFIRKHKLATFILILLIAGVTAVLIFRKTIMFDESEAIYGNRLDGIEKVPISSEQKKEIEGKFNERTKSIKVRTAGKVVYITIQTQTTADVATAKAMGEEALAEFTDQQKAFYDFQILINNEANEQQFPILGYKHHVKDAIAWTKDR